VPSRTAPILLVGCLFLAGCLQTSQLPTSSGPVNYPWRTAPVLGRLIKVDEYHPLTDREKVLAVARSRLGMRYRYGGSGPDRFDCSGFVRYVFGRVGIDMPRRSRDQFAVGQRITVEDLRPGDLVAFKIRSRRRVTHVGIYLGQGKFIHANSRGGSVRIDYLDSRYFRRRLAGCARVLTPPTLPLHAGFFPHLPWTQHPF
jgi:hypothetical protein